MSPIISEIIDQQTERWKTPVDYINLVCGLTTTGDKNDL
jgi:hypothetical protein